MCLKIHLPSNTLIFVDVIADTVPIITSQSLFISSILNIKLIYILLARKCQISEVAFLTEVFGAAFLFLYLGNQAHAAALRVEGRRVPAVFVLFSKVQKLF